MSPSKNESPDQFDRASALHELRLGLTRYLSAGATVETSSKQIEHLTEMSSPELNQLCSVHHLVSDDAQQAVSALPELVRRLPSTAVRDRLETRGYVQGQVQWPETVQAQLRTQDRSVFICSRPNRRYETPQGWLLRATVDNLHDAIRRTGYWQEASEDADPSQAAGVKNRVLETAYVVEPLLDSRKLREISRRALRPDMLDALRSRPALSPLCDLYENYQQLIVGREPQALIDALTTRFFAPHVDRMFELLTAFRIVDALKQTGWVERPPRGLLGPRTPVSHLAKDGRRVSVFWQTSVWDSSTARSFGLSSGELHQIVAHSRSRIRPYRPDLLVEIVEPDGFRSIRIGEVKLTSASGTRAEANGVLECLGYLRDAHALNAVDAGVRGFVVAWNATGRPSASGLIAISDQNHINELTTALLTR